MTRKVTIYFNACGDYVIHMADIYDFTEYKLHQLMERAAEARRDELADWLYFILNQYLEGKVLISFVNGMPVANELET